MERRASIGCRESYDKVSQCRTTGQRQAMWMGRVGVRLQRVKRRKR